MRVLTDNDFYKTIRDEPLAMVMFSAPWAGPCNMARPAYEETAGRLGNGMKFYEFILDDNPVIPEKYGVRQIPLFVMFSDGKPTSVLAGAVPTEVIVTMCIAELEKQ